MGRLVGIGGALTVIAVAGLFLGFGAYFVEDNKEGPQVAAPAVLSGAPSLMLDPACLWPVLDGAFSPDAPAVPARVTLRDCAPADATVESDGDWTRVSLQKGEPGDPDVERRFSGIRVAAFSDDGRLTLETYDNWGGSGVFSALITGKMSSDGEALEDIRVHAFGDRCNGGLAGTTIGGDGQVWASQNMTPWDIMVAPFADLPFEAQWAAAQERYGAALGIAPSCAACCSAVTREYMVEPDGALASVGFRYGPARDESSADSLTECLEKAVGTASGEDGLVAEDEFAALAALIESCAQEASK